MAVLNPEMGPKPRSYHSAVVHGHVVIVFGGHGNDTCDSNEVFHLNVKTLEWHLKSAGSDHASIFRAPQDEQLQREEVTVENLLVEAILGPAALEALSGSSSQGAQKAVDKAADRYPCRRDGHSAILNDGTMVVFGGARGRCMLNDLFIYRP